MKFNDDGSFADMTDRDVYRTSRRWIVWVILAAVFVPMLAWGASVLLSGPKGAGDVTKQNNSANNRISAQAFFEDTYEAVKKFDLQIGDSDDAYQEFLKTTPQPDADDSVQVMLYTQKVNGHQTTIEGLQQQCRNAVASYNAEARKTIREQWRSAELPYQIDDTAEATDCAPDTQS